MVHEIDPDVEMMFNDLHQAEKLQRANKMGAQCRWYRCLVSKAQEELDRKPNRSKSAAPTASTPRPASTRRSSRTRRRMLSPWGMVPSRHFVVLALGPRRSRTVCSSSR